MMNQDKKAGAKLAIIFDLGRVLIDVDFTRGLFKYYQGNRHETDSEIIERIFRDDLFITFATGKISPEELYKALTHKYKLPLTYDQFVRKWCDIFSPMDGMETLVHEIAANYPVGLLSDTDPLHWHYCLQTYPYLQLFNKPSLSYEIGALKPDPVCYLTAAKNVSRPPQLCLFIDDREKNVEGAKKVGMKSLLFTGVDDLRDELSTLHILR